MFIPDPMIAGAEGVWDEWTADNGSHAHLTQYCQLPLLEAEYWTIDLTCYSLFLGFNMKAYSEDTLDNSFSAFFLPPFIMHPSWICKFKSVQCQFSGIVQNQCLWSILLGQLVNTVGVFGREGTRFLTPKGIFDFELKPWRNFQFMTRW